MRILPFLEALCISAYFLSCSEANLVPVPEDGGKCYTELISAAIPISKYLFEVVHAADFICSEHMHHCISTLPDSLSETFKYSFLIAVFHISPKSHKILCCQHLPALSYGTYHDIL